MPDDTPNDQSSEIVCHLGPVGLVAIICSQYDALGIMAQQMLCNLKTLKEVAGKIECFAECFELLVPLGTRFPDTQLYIFERLCDLAEEGEQLDALDDYLEKLPDEIVGPALRALNKAGDRFREEADGVEAREGESPPESPNPPEPGSDQISLAD